MATMYDVTKLMWLPILYVREQTTASVYMLEEGPSQTEVGTPLRLSELHSSPKLRPETMDLLSTQSS